MKKGIPMYVLNNFKAQYGNIQKLNYSFGYISDFFKKLGCDIHIGNAHDFKTLNQQNADNRWYLLPDIFYKNPRFFSVLIYHNTTLIASGCFAPMDRHKNISLGETLLRYPEHYWDSNAQFNNNKINNIPEELFYMHGDVSFVFGLWVHKDFLKEHRDHNVIEHLSLLLKILIIGKENPDYCFFMVDPTFLRPIAGQTLLNKYHVHYHTPGPTWNDIIGKNISFESAWIDRVGMAHEIEKWIQHKIPQWENLHFQTLLYNRYDPL